MPSHEVKAVVLHVYNWLKARRPVIKGEKLGNRQLCVEATGFSENVICSIVKEANRNGGSLSDEAPPRKTRAVRPGKEFILEKLMSFCDEGNLNGYPISARKMKNMLFEKHGITISKPTICRWLGGTTYRFSKGDRRNILHNSPANVAYRHCYLGRRLANLNSSDVPIKPEVFLDESYCHLSHIRGETWVKRGGVVYTRGRAPMLVMFGAICVFERDGRSEGRIVDGSLAIWDPKRRHNEMDVPEAVASAGLIPDMNDYHGNFNSAIFEGIFESLCKKVSHHSK
jgi:transposase